MHECFHINVFISFSSLELRSHKEDFTYEPHTIDIRTGESRKEGYTSIAPHGKIPAIFDPHGPSNKPIKGVIHISIYT
jgi:glutathione S-transferase